MKSKLTAQLQNQIVPLVIIIFGIGCWVGGNLLNDRANGLNIALTLIGIGGGLVRQNVESTVQSDNVEEINVTQK